MKKLLLLLPFIATAAVADRLPEGSVVLTLVNNIESDVDATISLRGQNFPVERIDGNSSQMVNLPRAGNYLIQASYTNEYPLQHQSQILLHEDELIEPQAQQQAQPENQAITVQLVNNSEFPTTATIDNRVFRLGANSTVQAELPRANDYLVTTSYRRLLNIPANTELVLFQRGEDAEEEDEDESDNNDPMVDVG